MSILISPTPNVPNIITREARMLLETTRNNFTNLLRQWENGMRLVWEDRVDTEGNPYGASEMLAALGTNAVELFTISAGLRAYLETLKPGCTTACLVKYYRPVVEHSNGTITLATPPPSE